MGVLIPRPSAAPTRPGYTCSPSTRGGQTPGPTARKKLYEGGAEVLRAEWLEQMWKDKNGEWTKRAKTRLPKWFGERPGKKAGDPETPEGGDEAAEAEAEEYDEEEEDYEEEEEEEE